MPHGEESRRFEELLRKRGVELRPDDQVEKEIRERYEQHCAVLILDSSGFTRLTRKHGIVHYLALVADMKQRVEGLFDRHDAWFCWFEADNAYGVFATAQKALRCGLAIQFETGRVNSRRPEVSSLEVCIGIGSGELLRIGDENVFGSQMNLASKLGEDVAGPGEILLTRQAWEEVGDSIGGLTVEERSVTVGGVEIPYLSVE